MVPLGKSSAWTERPVCRTDAGAFDRRGAEHLTRCGRGASGAWCAAMRLSLVRAWAFGVAMDLGSRLSVVSIVSLIVVLASNCGAETGETGEGGAGGEDPGVTCGYDVCSEVLADTCAETYECSENNKCRGATEKPGREDGNMCTHDICDDGEWTHVPITAEEMDDGDPCTIDECSPVGGIQHINKC